MSSNLDPSNLIPVADVLAFFGITLEQYFNLDKVPFPVVEPTGRVVYPSLQTYDMRTSNPDDTGRNTLNKSYILRDCFVDYGTFTNNGYPDFKFRLSRSAVDENRTDMTYDSEHIKTETKDSSDSLYIHRNSGRQRKAYQMQTEDYLFSAFDLINGVHPDRAKIGDGKHKGVYDEASRSIIIEPKSTRAPRKTKQTQSKTTGTTPMAIKTDSIVEQNKAALITATQLEVGSLALDLVTTQVLKTLPAPVQLIIGDNPLAKIAIANVVNLVLAQTSLDDERLTVVNEAMMTVAWMETIRTLDVKGMVESALSSLPAAKLKALVDAKQAD